MPVEVMVKLSIDVDVPVWFSGADTKSSKDNNPVVCIGSGSQTQTDEFFC